MKNEELLLSAMGDMEDEFLMEAAEYTKKRRVRKRALLIAAAAAAALGVTAGAVGWSLRDSARADLGVSGDVPEYVEYEGAVTSAARDENIPYYVEGAQIELVSALCAGERVTAYLSVSPVTRDMIDKMGAETLEDFAFWEPTEVARPDEGMKMNGFSAGGRQVEYDPETQTALVRLELKGEVLTRTETFTVGLGWFCQQGEETEYRYYGAVTIPVTPSEELTFTLDVPLENEYLPGVAGTLTELRVNAGGVAVEVDYPAFAEVCQSLGDDARQTIGDAYWGYFDRQNGSYDPSDTYTELDAQVAYDRAWSGTLKQALAAMDAKLLLTDGTEVSLADAFPYKGGGGADGGSYTMELSAPVSLSQVEALILNGISYPAE